MQQSTCQSLGFLTQSINDDSSARSYAPVYVSAGCLSACLIVLAAKLQVVWCVSAIVVIPVLWSSETADVSKSEFVSLHSLQGRMWCRAHPPAHISGTFLGSLVCLDPKASRQYATECIMLRVHVYPMCVASYSWMYI